MPSYAYWFLLALLLLAMEMLTGTFYMLILSVAVGIGGLVAWLGLDVPVQITCSVVAGMIGVVIVRRLRSAGAAKPVEQNLDIGHTVRLLTLHDDGTARVHYRGAEWDAEIEGRQPDSAQPENLSPDVTPPAVLYIKAIHGSKLVLTLHKPSQH